MKEVKNFFTRGNRLNKGYAKVHGLKESDANNFYRKRFEHVLPPVDIMTEYEDIHPGTLEKLIAMAEKEQIHRHKLDLAITDNQYRATKRGQNFALAAVGFICVATISLAIVSTGWNAIAFSTISFAIVALVSFVGSKNPE